MKYIVVSYLLVHCCYVPRSSLGELRGRNKEKLINSFTILNEVKKTTTNENTLQSSALEWKHNNSLKERITVIY